MRLVSLLKAQGNIVAMTGDGVNDAPALTRADIGVAMGITGTEVTKDAAEMILTDDNFATIVAAVEGGRGLYDNLMKYIRFQMVVLIGFILTFLGAAIFDIADGTPLLPLQILWINFAIDVVLAVGLGFDAPTPRPDASADPARPTHPVIADSSGHDSAFAGLLIGDRHAARSSRAASTGTGSPSPRRWDSRPRRCCTSSPRSNGATPNRASSTATRSPTGGSTC